MAIVAGSRLGPYEVLGLLGAGGMGEVYRARDARLAREVAIKVLPASFSQDSDRLRRFEQEAKAAGLLNHPNITAVYDIGEHDGSTYVVSELLEGETLRSRLSGGPLPLRKALDYARQIAQGLSAAHEKGIVHRDLKPENLFVTKDGRIKILDFGLAKLTRPEEGAQTNQPTAAAGTEPGVVLGTLGYMSPEQVRGKPADHRSDIFSFGGILYEMLSGQRAFHGDSAADTMSAILMKEPEELSATNRNVPPGLDRIVRHCLEKNPEERFHSAHDLAFDLEALSGASGVGVATAGALGPARRRTVPIALAAALVLAALGGAFLAQRWLTRTKPAEPPRFERLTFRRGNLLSARFAPDGETVVFGASWGGPTEIFTTHPGSPEYRPVGLRNADVLAVSASGELAVSLRKRALYQPEGAGTLARVPMAGGSPRELLEDVESADWGPDGKEMLVARFLQGKNRIEFPIGKVLHTSDKPTLRPRFSPRGDRIAFLEGDRSGQRVMVLDLKGGVQALSDYHRRSGRVAWTPKGDEIWFDTDQELRAVDLRGRQRLLARVPGRILLHDISASGRVLVEQGVVMRGTLFGSTSDPGERDLSWFDDTAVVDLSADGETLLFRDRGPKGETSFYVRRTDGSPAVRLGDGIAHGLSPDGRSVLVWARDPQERLRVVPIGTGTARAIDPAGIERYNNILWMPDGRRVLFQGKAGNSPWRFYTQEVNGGKPTLVPSEPGFHTNGRPISPDGKWVVVYRDYAEGLFLLSLEEGGKPRPIPDTLPFDPVRWSADGRYLYVAEFQTVPMKVHRLDPFTGKREPWKELAPPDLLGLISIGNPVMTPDARAYAYSYSRSLVSDLYLIDGLK